MSSVSVRFNSFLFFIRFSMNTVEGQWKVKSEEWMLKNTLRFFLFYSLLPLTYSLHFMVGLDGLEPSTSRLSGVRSNHLSYRPFLLVAPRSFPSWFRRFRRLVEMMGFEPMTPCLQGRCSPSWATPPYHGLSFQRSFLTSENWTTKASILRASDLVNRLRYIRENVSWSP